MQASSPGTVGTSTPTDGGISDRDRVPSTIVIFFVVADGLGHYTPCDYVPYLKDAAIWLKEIVWME